MTTFHGYPQHHDCHPERPWWWRVAKWVTDYSDDRYLWRRVDDHEVEVVRPSYSDPTANALSAYDAAHPLPPPEPRCGQVWILQSGRHVLVTDVVPQTLPHVWMVALGSDPLGPRGASMPAPWPPPGAVLVAGPGSPWAPMGVPRG